MEQVSHIFITKRGMPLCVICSQVQVSASNARDRELPGATSLPAKVNLGLVLGEGKDGHANQPASVSEGSASLGEPEEDGNHSHSTASSQSSATYSNLGKNYTCKMICCFPECVSIFVYFT